MEWIRGLWTTPTNRKVAMAVSCPEPYCRAAKTWPCTTKNGKDSSTVHISRYRRWEKLNDAESHAPQEG
jgi:hypothetical protein